MDELREVVEKLRGPLPDRRADRLADRKEREASGRPTVAVVTLIHQLAARGGCVRQHADFDAAGLAITAWLAERAGTTPWRMAASDYLAVAPAAAAERMAESSRLGVLPSTPWDLRLQAAMAEWGIPVYEEELRADLLAAM